MTCLNTLHKTGQCLPVVLTTIVNAHYGHIVAVSLVYVYFGSLNGYVSFTCITKSCNVLEHSPCTPATATDQAPATAPDQAPATATDQAPATATDQAPAYSIYTSVN